MEAHKKTVRHKLQQNIGQPVQQQETIHVILASLAAHQKTDLAARRHSKVVGGVLTLLRARPPQSEVASVIVVEAVRSER